MLEAQYDESSVQIGCGYFGFGQQDMGCLHAPHGLAHHLTICIQRHGRIDDSPSVDQNHGCCGPCRLTRSQ